MNLNVRFYILKTTSYSMSLILIHAPNINTFFEITTIFGSFDTIIFLFYLPAGPPRSFFCQIFLN